MLGKEVCCLWEKGSTVGISYTAATLLLNNWSVMTSECWLINIRSAKQIDAYNIDFDYVKQHEYVSHSMHDWAIAL